MAFCINANPVINKGTHVAVNNINIGCCAGTNTGASNVVVGYCAGISNCQSCNVIIGTCAAPCGSTTLGGCNVIVGCCAGFTGSRWDGNVVIGNTAAAAANFTWTLCGNVYIGNLAGQLTPNSCNNVGIGQGALYNASGNCNIAIGRIAGCNMACSNNVIIGQNVGSSFTTSGNLVISDSSGAVRVCGAWNNCIGFGAVTPVVRAHSVDHIFATGEVIAYYSDRRLKENVTIINCALDKITKLNGVKYNANKLAEQFGFEGAKNEVGLLADEVEKEIPELVTLAPFDLAEGKKSKTGENYKTIKYERIVPYLIESIKELTKIVSDLESEWQMIIEESK